MPVTLKQLAARAHVHPSTISRVANRDPGLRIAPVTRQRIEALLRETEYRPNGIARGLKLRQTLVLGLYGLALAVLFVVFQAPDVALSELVVSSVAFPFILLSALAKLRGRRRE